MKRFVIGRWQYVRESETRESPGSLRHVMVRGIERSGIALEDKDRKDDVKRIGKEAENNKTVIYARKPCW
ncbi:hypothetical protein [Chlorobium sp. KB01]|uniref:hypothetical protein n=1 Tax=Chlorobium sp. KB01 TaxID=1917528 RepID=UPI0011854686|nr:hypothetical protein [Chlorobium sp. KB01]